MDKKIKHLEMIQEVIKRMASNSFFLKGWSITLVAGIFALAAKDSNQKFFLIAYFPLIVFWILDTYYLQQERKYRNLYDKVRCIKEEKVDFSMNITQDLINEKTGYFNCFLSLSEGIFYFPTIVLIGAIIAWM